MFMILMWFWIETHVKFWSIRLITFSIDSEYGIDDRSKKVSFISMSLGLMNQLYL